MGQDEIGRILAERLGQQRGYADFFDWPDKSVKEGGIAHSFFEELERDNGPKIVSAKLHPGGQSMRPLRCSMRKLVTKARCSQWVPWLIVMPRVRVCLKTTLKPISGLIWRPLLVCGLPPTTVIALQRKCRLTSLSTRSAKRRIPSSRCSNLNLHRGLKSARGIRFHSCLGEHLGRSATPYADSNFQKATYATARPHVIAAGSLKCTRQAR
jgi:hypothetical protein